MTDHAPTLFEMVPAAPVASDDVNARQAVIDAALAKAKAEWKERYERFILTYAAIAPEPFTAETIREAYLASPGVPTTDHQQASGAIFQRLVKTGHLRPAGMKRSKRYGNLLQAYVMGNPA